MANMLGNKCIQLIPSVRVFTWNTPYFGCELSLYIFRIINGAIKLLTSYA